MVHHLGKADWTDKDRINGLISSYNRRYDEEFWAGLMDLVGDLPRNTIADFGCGPGLFLVDASRRFSARMIIGLDESKEMLEQAKLFIEERSQVESYELIATNFDEGRIPIPSTSVDLAFCGFMLHEVTYPQDFVGQVGKTLRPAGMYVIYDYISGDEEEFVRKMVAQGMSAERAKRRYPHMCKHSLDDIKELLTRAGFKDIRGGAVNHIRALVVGLMSNPDT